MTPKEELYFLELDLTVESSKQKPDKKWITLLKRSIRILKKELKNG